MLSSRNSEVPCIESQALKFQVIIGWVSRDLSTPVHSSHRSMQDKKRGNASGYRQYDRFVGLEKD